MKKEKTKTKITYRKYELDIDTAQKVFNKFNLGSVSSVKRFEQGMINDVFSVNNQYVFKINTAQPDSPKLEKESLIYEVLPVLGIPVPTFVVFDKSNEIINYPYLIYKQIAGESLETLSENLDLKMKDGLLQHMGELLGRIHSLKLADVKLPEQEEYLGLKKDIVDRINKISSELLKSQVLKPKTVLGIKNFYLESSLFDEDVNPSLLHGNYGLGNIIVDEGKINGIIDWEWTSFGHNEEELAVLLYRVYKTEHQQEVFKKGYLNTSTISLDFDNRRLAYVLLYFLKVLPHVPGWTHKPDKQKEYFDEVETLIRQIGL